MLEGKMLDWEEDGFNSNKCDRERGSDWDSRPTYLGEENVGMGGLAEEVDDQATCRGIADT